MSHYNGWIDPVTVKAMKGRKVVDIKGTSAGGVEYSVIVLEGGFEIAVLSDHEGNNGGVLALEACPREFAKANKIKSMT